MKPYHFGPGLALSLASLTLIGCSALKPKADLTRFYVLSSQLPAPPSASSKLAPGSTIVIGPSQLPHYLQATPIVVDDGPNRILRLDLHQWAEPLDKGIGRVLANNLSQLLGTSRVVVYPEPAAEGPGYDLSYVFSKFDGSLSGDVILEVSWRVQERGTGKTLAEKTSQYMIPAAGGPSDPVGYVARMSEALGRWSADIAAEITSP